MYPLPLPVTAPVMQSGSVNPTMPVLSMTHVSALVLVASPWLSPLVHHYRLTPPSPCTLGQQVTAYCLGYRLVSLLSLLFGHSWLVHYCLGLLIVSIVLKKSLVSSDDSYCAYICLLLVV